jgi:hypothetical protein
MLSVSWTILAALTIYFHRDIVYSLTLCYETPRSSFMYACGLPSRSSSVTIRVENLALLKPQYYSLCTSTLALHTYKLSDHLGIYTMPIDIHA